MFGVWTKVFGDQGILVLQCVHLAGWQAHHSGAQDGVRNGANKPRSLAVMQFLQHATASPSGGLCLGYRCGPVGAAGL